MIMDPADMRFVPVTFEELSARRLGPALPPNEARCTASVRRKGQEPEPKEEESEEQQNRQVGASRGEPGDRRGGTRVLRGVGAGCSWWAVAPRCLGAEVAEEGARQELARTSKNESKSGRNRSHHLNGQERPRWHSESCKYWKSAKLAAYEEGTWVQVPCLCAVRRCSASTPREVPSPAPNTQYLDGSARKS